MRTTAIATVICLLAACSSPTPRPPRYGNAADALSVASADQVRNCRYVDDVTGTSGLYGVFASKGVTEARNEAMLQARSKGANRIVWDPPLLGYGGTSITAKAYRCEAVE